MPKAAVRLSSASGSAPITWPSGDTTVVLVEACAGLGVMRALLCQHGSRYQRSHTDGGHQNLLSHLVASPLRPK